MMDLEGMLGVGIGAGLGGITTLAMEPDGTRIRLECGSGAVLDIPQLGGLIDVLQGAKECQFGRFAARWSGPGEVEIWIGPAGARLGAGSIATALEILETHYVRERVQVEDRIDDNGRVLVLVDPNGPDEHAASPLPWMAANHRLRRVTLVDPTDDPHASGLTVVRQDVDGWYVRIGPCMGYSDDLLDPDVIQEYGPCRGQAREMLAEERAENGRVTEYTCPACAAQDARER